MRALIQRVSSASCVVDGQTTGRIDKGYMILLGVGKEDSEAEAAQLWKKILNLRIFPDENGKTNLSIRDAGGNVLAVSQFTLYADTTRGNRPGFTYSADPETANSLYEYFCELIEADLGQVERGVFGAHMEITLTNDGPFTIWLDTDTWKKK